MVCMWCVCFCLVVELLFCSICNFIGFSESRFRCRLLNSVDRVSSRIVLRVCSYVGGSRFLFGLYSCGWMCSRKLLVVLWWC